jgi:hypothetical protein
MRAPGALRYGRAYAASRGAAIHAVFGRDDLGPMALLETLETRRSRLPIGRLAQS